MTEPHPPSSAARIGGSGRTDSADTPPPAITARPSLLGRLVEPHPSIEEVGARHLVRLLCSFLLALSALAAMICLFAVLQHNGTTIFWTLFYTGLLMASYAISRTRHFIWAARGATAALCMMPIASTYFIQLEQPTGQLDDATWLLLGIVFGNLYFSTRTMACVVLACMAGIAFLGLSLPEIELREVTRVEWLVLFVSALVLISGRALRIVERDRLALLERRRQELVELTRSMETMLYVISHDLKEPLRSIHGFSDTVNRKYAGQLDDKGRDYLTRVVRGAERMRGLLDDIVQLLRAQRIVPRRVGTPAQALVETVLTRLASRIEETKARVGVMPALPVLWVEQTWGVTALQHLVENALKYTRDGAPPEIEIAPYHEGAISGLVVRDRGPGVPELYTEKIFNLFQRAVGRDIPGTGAGLAIVRQITRRHGGHAWVQPRDGGGSEFVMTFRDHAHAGSELDGDDAGAISGLWDPPTPKTAPDTKTDTKTDTKKRTKTLSGLEREQGRQ